MSEATQQIPWGPTGELVYRRSYSRALADGTPEEWPDTVRRVVDGNLALVPDGHQLPDERRQLEDLLLRFAALPAGRHLWMSGVSGRQFLFNCHVAGWDRDDPAAHFRFLFNQLMQGGGVGANYSNRFVDGVPKVTGRSEVHLVCDDGHADIAELLPHLSPVYSPMWPGSMRVDDSREGWVDALGAVLDRFWGHEHEPLVLDLSLLRGRGEPIRSFGGTASGPAPLAAMLAKVAAFLGGKVGAGLSSLDAMTIDHWIAEAVVAGNVRRSARMSMKHWADPDIGEFIEAKTDPLLHWSTNISVEVDDDFLAAVAGGDGRATEVFAAATDGMLHNGEPGVWNRSLAQVGERGQVVCTNPCGEIALEEWENCNLGHINLGAFADDVDGAVEAHRLMARFLVRATFGDVPDERQRAVLLRNRRIGVGHLGYQGWVVRQGIRYSESASHPHVREALGRFARAVRAEAESYTAELGIASPVKVTTVAPTGSVAKLPGATEGIQPIYARYFIRRVRLAESDPEVEVQRALGHELEPDLYSPNTVVVAIPTKDTLVEQIESAGGDVGLIESADEIPLEAQLAVQTMYQSVYADNAVSMTVNLADSVDPDGVRDVLLRALPHLKGTTLMIDESRPQAPYERISRAEYEASTGQEVDGSAGSCLGDACPIGNEGLH